MPELEHSFYCRGFMCYIILRRMTNTLYRCGYVAVPEDKDSFDVSDIWCHGGITYDYYKPPTPLAIKDKKHYIGFDCLHFADTIDEWTLNKVRKELINIVNQILEQESEE